MRTDSLFYRLFQADPAIALELAGLVVAEPGRYRFVSQEIKQTAYRLDGVLEPPADLPDAPLAFIEVQNQPDDSFYLRFFSEILLHLRQYRPAHPWQAVVFYPERAVERLDELSRPILSLPNLQRIFLNELPLLESANPKLWLIALILAEETQVRAIVSRVQAHRLQNPEDGINWLELLETVLVYKLPRFTREEIQAMFQFNDIDLKQTRFCQQARTEGEAELLLRLLERRFGPLSEAARQQVTKADAETLLVWGDRILDAKTLAEVWGG
jgi:predicted transposase/invertase (TIGR01784 family)